MTRKTLSRQADVSERHLAQLEAGEGNISVVLLRRIAAALQVSLADLFVVQSEAPAERQTILQFLDRLPPHRLEDVVARLTRDFVPEQETRRQRIALIDRKSTRLNSSHANISYAVFCLKKKKNST